MKYIRILWSYLCGLVYTLWLMLLPKNRLAPVEGKAHPHLVVTLTSYGRRVGFIVGPD